MLVRVVRVARLPGGSSMLVDDQLDTPVVWVLEDDFSVAEAAMMETAFNTLNGYQSRKPARRATLRAV